MSWPFFRPLDRLKLTMAVVLLLSAATSFWLDVRDPETTPTPTVQIQAVADAANEPTREPTPVPQPPAFDSEVEQTARVKRSTPTSLFYSL